jgi:hypothetical protein
MAGAAATTSSSTASSVDELRHLVGPTALAAERTLPLIEPLGSLFPHGALGRGVTVAISGTGATSLALALAAGPSTDGSWVGFVGWSAVGWGAAAGYGIDLSRTVVVPDVPTGDWSTVSAALLDAIDVVVVAPTHPVDLRIARRLVARARERGSVLLVVASRYGWPESPDLALTIDRVEWSGLGRGHGHLRSRRVSVGVLGRRAAALGRSLEVWLPTSTGELAPVADATDTERRLRAV